MSPAQVLNENSQEPRAFDRLLSLIPNAEPEKKSVGGEGSEEAKEDTDLVNKDDSAASESHYSVKTPTGSRSLTKLGAAAEQAKTPETPKVDVHNLWSMLVSSGLVPSNETSSSSGIPGIDSNVATPTKEKKPEEKKEKPDEKSEQDQPEATKPANEVQPPPQGDQPKPVEVQAEAPQQQDEAALDEEPVDIVLKSHHQTLKE